MPVHREALEGVPDGVFYVGGLEHDYEVGDGITAEVSRNESKVRDRLERLVSNFYNDSPIFAAKKLHQTRPQIFSDL